MNLTRDVPVERWSKKAPSLGTMGPEVTVSKLTGLSQPITEFKRVTEPSLSHVVSNFKERQCTYLKELSWSSIPALSYLQLHGHKPLGISLNF